jgi:hypothetical protein
LAFKIFVVFLEAMNKPDAFGDEVNVTPQAMRTIANALRSIAKRHDEVADWMEKDGISGVRSKNLRSVALALVPLAKFLGAVVAAYCDQVSATGLEPLAGGVVLLTKYLKRTSDDLLENEPKKSRKTDPEIQGAAEGEAARDIARKRLRKKSSGNNKTSR